MSYYQPQGHSGQFTSQDRQSTQNNQDCQTPSLFRQRIFHIAGLSDKPACQISEFQKSVYKQAHCLAFVLPSTADLLTKSNQSDLTKSNQSDLGSNTTC